VYRTHHRSFVTTHRVARSHGDASHRARSDARTTAWSGGFVTTPLPPPGQLVSEDEDGDEDEDEDDARAATAPASSLDRERLLTLVPIRPRWRGERGSLRTLPGAARGRARREATSRDVAVVDLAAAATIARGEDDAAVVIVHSVRRARTRA
jgi:hypothetical protein